MKKSWRFVSLAIILVVILTTIIGVGAVSAQSVCSPATAISVPFVKDGAGSFCYQATSMCYAINSWNTTLVQINGNNYTNMWVSGPSIPALNGVFTITYNGGQFGHFEIAGPCSGGSSTATSTRTPTRASTACDTPTSCITGTPATPTRTWTPTSGSSLTPTRTNTLGPTATRTRTPTPGAVTLTPTPMPVDFSGSPTVGVAPLSVTFTIQATDPSQFARCVWTFSDGTNYEELDVCHAVTHVYTQPGTYIVALSYTLDSGYSSVVGKNNYISVIPCAVDAVISAPFVKDGPGTFCWQSNNMGSSITSSNLDSLWVNLSNFGNGHYGSNFYPALINGHWYISYKCTSSPLCHFEMQP